MATCGQCNGEGTVPGVVMGRQQMIRCPGCFLTNDGADSAYNIVPGQIRSKWDRTD